MSSSITNYSNRIDINYPVVGKNNDTQGFRDNFSNIQSAFIVASSEITELQNNGVKLSEDNNFNFNTIENAILKNISYVAAPSVSINTNTDYKTIDYSQANYFKYSLDSSAWPRYYSFEITNWPNTNTVGTVFIELDPVNSTTATLNITGTGVINLLGVNNFPRTYTSTNTIVYEAWSTDNGATIYVLELTGV